MRAELAVVIVTYNSARVIENLLATIPAALGGLTADVVVVDNGSTDGTADLVAARADCRLVRAANGGYAAGINRGAREAKDAPALLVLNPDITLAAGSIPPLLAALRLPGTGVVAPQVRTPAGALHRSLRREPTLARAMGLNFTGLPIFSEYVSEPADYTRPHVVDWALGAALLISRECFDAVGGWDESYFLYSEETDFCLAARDRGWLTRYEPAAVLTHIGGGSGQSAATHTMQIVNRVRLYRRRHATAAAWLYFALTVASELTWAVRSGRRSALAVVALIRPSRRPPELGCSDRVLPA